MVAEPVPLWNFTPLGSFPLSLSLGTGIPEVVTGNVKNAPSVAVVWLALVMLGPGVPMLTVWLAVAAARY